MSPRFPFPSFELPPARAAIGVALAGALVFVTVGPDAGPAGAQVGTPDRIGQWSEVFLEPGLTRPPVPEAMSVLPDGRILYLDGNDAPPPDGPDRRVGLLDLRTGWPVFDAPSSTDAGAAGAVPAGGADLVTLADGRVLIGSGPAASSSSGGTTYFEPGADRFAGAGPMAHSHHQASLVTLADGRVLVAGGAAPSSDGRVVVPTTTGVRPVPAETFDPGRGIWGHDPAATAPLPLEPGLHLMPNGQVFYGGGGRDTLTAGSVPEETLAQQRFFDPRTSTWTVAGPSPYGPRDGALSVPLPVEPPYDQATLLTAGGGAGRGGAGTPALGLATLTTVDAMGATSHSRTGDLTAPRRSASAVGLPDGTVFVVGGSSGLPGPGVASAELYDPASGNWTGMHSPSEARPDRHSAVLLPDGRVLYGGPSARRPGAVSYEIYSPPYLFRGARPRLRTAPSALPWGGSFEVTSPDAGGIEEVVLSRLGSPRHGADTDAHTLRLTFTRSGSNTLTAQAPPDGIAAPPGYYYLFILRTTMGGPVPSVARIVKVG